MNAGPSRGGARLPEKRLTARSKAPQKKCEGLHLPTKEQRACVYTSSICRKMRQHRFAKTGSYDAWTVSSVNRIGVGISTGIGQIWTPSPISESSARTAL